MLLSNKLPAILLLCLTAIAGSAFASDRNNIVNAFNECIYQLLGREKPPTMSDELSLRVACPDLVQYLNDPALKYFSPPLKNSTSLAQLLDITKALKNTVKTNDEQTWQLEHNRLDKVLEEVYVPEKDPKEIKSFTDVFWEWVRHKLEEFFDSDNWFTRNFDTDINPDSNFFEGLKNTVIVILIAFILYIVINELYAANITKFFARRKAKKLARTASLDSPGAQLKGLNDILTLSVRQQVPAMLKYSLQLLIRKGFIPKQYSLTNREFLAIANRYAPEIARDLEMIVTTSDRVVYGNRSIAAGDANMLLERVRHIEKLHYRNQT